MPRRASQSPRPPAEAPRRHGHQGPPHLVHQLLEWRALAEMATLPAALPLLATSPAGDGHPVLLLPGFLGDEGSLLALRTFLSQRGYDVSTWGFGRNVGFQARHAQALEQKIRHLHHVTGRKVSLVGWSLGGVFVSVDPAGSQSPALVRALYRLVAHPLGPTAHALQPRAKKVRERHRLPLPMSCLYSLSDGVVPPQEATIDGDPALHENIRVAGSHTGLGFNPLVLAIVAERLAQPEGQWQPFQPQGLLRQVLRAATALGD